MIAHEILETIYVVDDAPYLTELYTALLEGAGYGVRAFDDRAEALAALKADRTKPDLLITDYRGRSMPVERFMRRCLAVHPALRILMASGFCETDVRISRAKPDRFLRKPFTPEELFRAVKAALSCRRAEKTFRNERDHQHRDVHQPVLSLEEVTAAVPSKKL